MPKTLFEQRLEMLNRETKEKKLKRPEFAFSFVGETSKEAEIELQTKFVLALMDFNALGLL